MSDFENGKLIENSDDYDYPDLSVKQKLCLVFTYNNEFSHVINTLINSLYDKDSPEILDTFNSILKYPHNKIDGLFISEEDKRIKLIIEWHKVNHNSSEILNPQSDIKSICLALTSSLNKYFSNNGINEFFSDELCHYAKVLLHMNLDAYTNDEETLTEEKQREILDKLIEKSEFKIIFIEIEQPEWSQSKREN